MSEKLEDVKVAVSANMTLELKEVRGTSTMYSRKEGYEEVSSETKTRFHWRLCGIASKLGPEAIQAEDFDVNEQEIYDVTFQSQGFGVNFAGFKSREAAIGEALAFAKRNGIKVDGYAGSIRDNETH